MFQTFVRVFRHGRSAIVAFAVTVIVLLFIAFLPNLGVIGRVLATENASLGSRLEFVLQLSLSPLSSMSPLSLTLAAGAAVLIGVNTALLLYYVRCRQVKSRDRAAQAAGLGGMVSAVLGIGCAACGSAVLTVVAGVVGATGLIAVLPLHGAEFGVLGVGLLLLTAWFLLRRIADPLVCHIDS